VKISDKPYQNLSSVHEGSISVVENHIIFFTPNMPLVKGPLSLVSITEELLERKSSGSGLENREYGHRHPLSAEVGTNFADKWRSLGRYS
jgi:hypothetical protein